MWTAISYVTSALTLVAFLAAVAASIYFAYARKLARELASADTDKKTEIIMTNLRLFDPDIKTLPAGKRFELAVIQLEHKQKSFYLYIIFLAVAAALFAMTTLFAIWRLGGLPTDEVSKEMSRGEATLQTIEAAKATCTQSADELNDDTLLDRFVEDLNSRRSKLSFIWGGKVATSLPENTNSPITDVHREDNSLVFRYKWQDGVVRVWPTARYGMSSNAIHFRGVWKQTNGGGCLTLDMPLSLVSLSSKGTWYEGLKTDAGWSFSLVDE